MLTDFITEIGKKEKIQKILRLGKVQTHKTTITMIFMMT